MFSLVLTSRLRDQAVRLGVAEAEVVSLRRQLENATHAAQQERRENRRLLDRIMLMKRDGYGSAHGDGDAPTWGRYSTEQVEREMYEQPKPRPKIDLDDDPAVMAIENELRSAVFRIDDEE